MKTQFRIYKNNGERDVLKWKEELDVPDDFSVEAVFDLYKEKYLADARDITFAGTNHYRTEKRQMLVITFYW